MTFNRTRNYITDSPRLLRPPPPSSLSCECCRVGINTQVYIIYIYIGINIIYITIYVPPECDDVSDGRICDKRNNKINNACCSYNVIRTIMCVALNDLNILPSLTIHTNRNIIEYSKSNVF